MYTELDRKRRLELPNKNISVPIARLVPARKEIISQSSYNYKALSYLMLRLWALYSITVLMGRDMTLVMVSLYK